MTKGPMMVMTLESPAIQRTVAMPGCHIRKALLKANSVRTPFPHWLLRDVLPAWLREAIRAMPFPPAATGDSLGKRETYNSRRIFVSEENRERFLACEVLADVFQDEATIGLLEDLTGANLAGGFTRIEYCLDSDGFWLEPHTDIGAKLLTMVIYLSEHPAAENWGTDIMDATGTALGRASGAANHGLLFVPGSDTWHGFVKRPIEGVRRSLIVNYVKPEWNSRHELAFPGQAVVSGNSI
jgi:hypothetical protein